jgi:hypothetical protein
LGGGGPHTLFSLPIIQSYFTNTYKNSTNNQYNMHMSTNYIQTTTI